MVLYVEKSTTGHDKILHSVVLRHFYKISYKNCRSSTGIGQLGRTKVRTGRTIFGLRFFVLPYFLRTSSKWHSGMR